MVVDTFSNPWNDTYGYTYKEAEKKRDAVTEAYGAYQPNSKWNPAEIVPDKSRKGGFMVVITTKKKKV